MKYEQRKEKMLDLLKNHEFVNIQTLVDVLNSSEATIRRDIVRMEEEGIVKRYWGGIKRIETPKSIRDRSLKNIDNEEADRIGRYAASIVNKGDLIYIGSGVTTLAMVKYLDKQQNITVVTNGIPQLEALYNKGIQALLLCGFYKEYSQSVVGSETIEMLRRYKFDKAFFGAHGIGENYTILSADSYENELKKLSIQNAKQTYCLVKKDKFEKKAYYQITRELSREVTLITDEAIKEPEKWEYVQDIYCAKIKNLND